MSIKINEDLKKTIKNKEKKPSAEINFNDCFIFISIGFNIVITYIIFLLIAKLLTKYINFNNIYVVAVMLGTVSNIFSIINIVNKNKKKDKKNAK